MTIVDSALPVAKEPLAADASAAETSGWQRFESVLDRLGDRLNPILVKEARQAMKSRQFVVTFSLLLIDSALWSRFTPEPAGIELSIHTAGPDRGEPLVLTSANVIRSVLDGRLTAGDALSRGLIRVEAETDHKLALFELLAAAKGDRSTGPERR